MRQIPRPNRSHHQPRIVEASRGADPAGAPRGDSPMAVRTPHLAPLDLSMDLGGGSPASDQLGQGALAFAHVIELQDRDIGFPAVDAWMLLEVCDDNPAGSLRPAPLRLGGLSPMQVTALLEVRAKAFTAPLLEPISCAIERTERKALSALPAAFAVTVRHERMFVHPSDRTAGRGYPAPDGGRGENRVAARTAPATGSGGRRAGDHRGGGVVPARATVP
jgi:hypothetical protein